MAGVATTAIAWVQLNQSIFRIKWPTSLQQLSFGSCFNQHLVCVEWPVSLQQLSFGELFNQPSLLTYFQQRKRAYFLHNRW